jgi:hypothetical protein
MSCNTTYGFNSLTGKRKATYGYNSLVGNVCEPQVQPSAPVDSVQYNDSGDFGGDSAFTYNQSTATLAVTNIKPTTITDDVNSVGTSGQYLSSTGTGVDWVTPPTLPVPGGVSTNIQFNNAGSFGGSANFVRNLSTDAVSINGNLGIGSLAAPPHRLTIDGANSTIFNKSSTSVCSLTLSDSSSQAKQFLLQLNGTANTSDIFSLQQGVLFRPVRINPTAPLNEARMSIGTTSANASGIQLANHLVNRRIILFESANNDHQFHGLGINSQTFRFQIPDTASRYVWFAGTATNASAELMRLTGTGELIVGQSATSLIQVAKIASTSTLGYLRVGGNETGVNTYRLIGFGYTFSNSNQPAYIGYQERVNTGNTSGDLVFGTRSVTTNTVPTERMRILADGNVVVGRNATSLITISKGTGATASNSFQGYLKVGGDEIGAAVNTKLMIGFGYNTGTNNQPAYIGYEERSTTGDTFGDLIFGTRDTTTGNILPTERLRILGNGNICVGTNTTTYNFQVVGTASFNSVDCGGVTFVNSANALTFSNTSTVRNGNNGFNLSSNAGTAVIISSFAQPYPFNLANGVSRAFYDYSTYILTISPGNSSSFSGLGRWQFNVQVPVVSGTSGAMALQSAAAIGGPYTTVAYTEQYNTFVLKLLYAVNVTTITFFRLVSVGGIHTVNMNNLDCFYCIDCLG